MKCIFNKKNLVLAVAFVIVLGVFMKGEMPYDGSLEPDSSNGSEESQYEVNRTDSDAEENSDVEVVAPELLLVRYDEEKLSKATKLEIKEADATTFLVSNSGNTYPVEYSYDGDITSSWQDGTEGYGEGESLSYWFKEPVKLKYICIYPGSGENEDKFYQNGRPREISFLLDGLNYNLILADTPVFQMIEVSGDLTCDWASLILTSVYEGSKYQDTCLAEIEFYAE